MNGGWEVARGERRARAVVLVGVAAVMIGVTTAIALVSSSMTLRQEATTKLAVALDSVLPPTGLEIAGPIAIGVAFLALGAILTVVTKRIERTAASSR